MRKFDETADIHSRRPDAKEPWLVISSTAGVRAVPLPRLPRVIIGRLHTCDIVIEDDSVSRQHAAITVGPGGLAVEDLGSRNRTKVGGRSLTRGESAGLPVGAVVEVGYATMFVQLGRPPSSVASGAGSPAAPVRTQAVVSDPTMQRLYGLLEVIAPSPLNVVILGETGTGKEVFAEAMHKGSVRASRPFLKVNCAALSGSLLESELFGHERGAFTGALGAKEGLFEAADGGTVFLDEVGELPTETQAKLLRVVEYGEVIRLGSVQPRKVDVRYVAATNRDLTAAISTGRFRSDLFFRLNGFSVTIPPLRKRPRDILPLATHFLDRMARGRPYVLSPGAQAVLHSYPWPGNVRELKQVLDRALVLAGSAGQIDTVHLQLPETHSPDPTGDALTSLVDTIPPMPVAQLGLPPMPAVTPAWGAPAVAPMPTGSPLAATAPAPVAGAVDLRSQRESWEKQQILQALERTSGNQKEAAKLLGVSRRTLINKIEAYGIARPRKRT